MATADRRTRTSTVSQAAGGDGCARHGLNQVEVAAALEPFRNGAPSEQASGSAVNLSLSKAPVEANRAQFQIRTAPQSGTLIEVAFPYAPARA